MRNDGSEAQNKFISLMEAQPKTKVFRLRDKKDLMGINRGRRVNTFPLPSDFIVVQQGEIFFAEVKSTENVNRFGYSNIEKGQRAAATICAACGAPYWFYIWSIAEQKWFRFSAQQFADDIAAGVKSRLFKDMEVAGLS